MTDEKRKAWDIWDALVKWAIRFPEGPNCAILAADAELTALRAEVERLREEWRIQAETAVKRLGRIAQLEEAVEWALSQPWMDYVKDELRRRAGRE